MITAYDHVPDSLADPSQAQIRPHVPVTEPLEAGDLLIILGEDERLGQVCEWVDDQF